MSATVLDFKPKAQRAPLVQGIERQSNKPDSLSAHELAFYWQALEALRNTDAMLVQIRDAENSHKRSLLTLHLERARADLGAALAAMYQGVADSPRSEYERVNVDRRALVAALVDLVAPSRLGATG